MHPAPSVILFTVMSGAGFGMLAFLGIGLPDVAGWVAFTFFAIAYVLAVGGLLASTFHLEHPERAIKAFSQWRTSWLSREGCCAVFTLIVMAVYGAGLVFLGTRWTALGLVGSVASVLTVFTTSMIYAQLRTVPRWHSPLTPALLLSLSLAGGALLTGQEKAAIALLVVAGAIQIMTWMKGDGALTASGSTLASATGLGTASTVRAFEPPHTGTNYLLNEFVYVVGRKHGLQLRVISFFLMILLPIGMLLLPFSHMFAALAVLSHLVGAVVSRWLFFAEAEHVVGLYYGKRTT
ncbi:dimethyl sulfoxide reductase anchor subunit family protein [Sedimentitalea sp. XS_ASV28]|uniref:dimethyl sulfoxide reductase anchor subunit family protein n=1 Tax=Sedimentitalea sp. XS_ASV28 TaxID=3241296 RepID=UPI003518D4B2